ncbi:MAG TPA: nucleotidyltransferase domain-containing protein [bacterium]|jgi:predicted nucleotidyltransferase|nr:nucleotidyltransferase domain-containing protein [bacterium]HPC78430.1 nucleotidyltransferase domain-containing protein [bacterium]HPO82813.1 nucleotidyltransferase domain-containing protein [bacterium]HRR91738.1 nucleotidyltransferase domain-containing protein [bacterium]
MRQDDYEIAEKLRVKLSKVVSLVDFRVFGSRARGEGDEYSDMDIFLEVEALNEGLKERILDIIWEVSFETCIVISPLIFTKEEIENSPLKVSPLVKNIMEEGIKI